MTLPSSHFEDYLTAVTDAVLRGERDIDRIAARYGVSAAEAEQIAPLIGRLKAVCRPERPSERYTRKLRRDLMGTPDYTLVERVRYLPPRVQLAAGAAVSITAVLLVIGRFGLPVLRLATGRGLVRGYTPAS